MRYALLLLLAACAPMLVWQHPTKSEADYVQDRRECEYDAAKATVSIVSGIMAGVQKSSLTDQCLEARGYYRARAPHQEAVRYVPCEIDGRLTYIPSLDCSIKGGRQ